MIKLPTIRFGQRNYSGRAVSYNVSFSPLLAFSRFLDSRSARLLLVLRLEASRIYLPAVPGAVILTSIYIYQFIQANQLRRNLMKAARCRHAPRLLHRDHLFCTWICKERIGEKPDRRR